MNLQDLVADGQLLVAVLVAFAAGVVSFASPCVLPLVPGYLGYVGASVTPTQGVGAASGAAAAAARGAKRGAASVTPTQGVGAASGAAAAAARGAKRSAATASAASVRGRLVLGVLLFVAGFTAVFVAMMAAAGSVGVWLLQWEQVITRVMGVIVIVMGLVFMGMLGAMQTTKKLRVKPRVGLAGAPLLGAVFAIGWTPCIGPTLAVIMGLSLQSGSVGRSIALAVAYSIGLGLPFLLVALGFGWVTQTTNFMRRHIRAVNVIGGVLLILIGLLMVTGLWTRMMYAFQAVIDGFVPAI